MMTSTTMPSVTMETNAEHDWNKEYMPFKLWELLRHEIRYKGDTKEFSNEKDAIIAAVEEMDPQDIFGKVLIFEVRQNPYYSDETEAMLIGAVNYLGEITHF